MELSEARVLVAGATGALGGHLTARLSDAGAHLALAGRNAERLQALQSTYSDVPVLAFEAIEIDGCADVVDQAVAELGGLDALVVATGVAVFGNAGGTDDAVAEEVFAVNTLAPMALTRAALGHLGQGTTIALISAVLADYPTAGMADYSASKAALSAWLTALRRELRARSVTVCDLRPPHMDTGLADRALAGTPPVLPEPHDPQQMADHIVAAIHAGNSELYYDAAAQRVLTR